MMSRILLSPPEAGLDERSHLLAALDDGWLAPVGPDLERFEREMCDTVERSEGVALSSGTGALHLALVAHGIGEGDVVIVSDLTFAASVNPIRYVGATPLLVDSELDSWTISPGLVEEAMTGVDGRRPRAAVIVDLYGQPADHTTIGPLLADRGVIHLVDAAESLGSIHAGRPAPAFGAAAVLSFNGNKIITTTGGGMLVTDDRRVADHVRHLATQAREPVAHYEHREVGYNYRLSNLLAAFGRAQLADLERRVSRRRAIFDAYTDAFADLPGVSMMPEVATDRATHWLTCMTIDEDDAGYDPVALRLHLDALDIEARPLWKPMHLQPVFADCPALLNGTSADLYRRGICLPSGSSLTATDQERVIDGVIALAESRR